MEQSKFYQIKNVTEHEYTLVGCDGSVITRPTQDVDKSASAFTIQDAKDGDMIYVSTEAKGIQAIFHKFENGIIYFHCYLCRDFAQGGYMPIGSVELVYPLQKTHYNKFFEKMHEAGYEWDATKKELKKIEQSPSWSEEDEKTIDEAVECLENYAENVQGGFSKQHVFNLASRVESLKDRYFWKPSDTQLHYLSWIANIKLGDSVVEQEVSKHLNELLEDLKKLKEE